MAIPGGSSVVRGRCYLHTRLPHVYHDSTIVRLSLRVSYFCMQAFLAGQDVCAEFEEEVLCEDGGDKTPKIPQISGLQCPRNG